MEALRLGINFEKSTDKDYYSNNLSLAFAGDGKRTFTLAPNGTNFSIYDWKFFESGILVKRYHNNHELDYSFSIFQIEQVEYNINTIPLDENLVKFKYIYESSFSIFKLIVINKSIFYNFDIEWIKIAFGQFYKIYLKKEDYFFIIGYGGVGYSSFKPDNRTSINLNEYNNSSFSGIDAELGTKLKFEYKEFEIEAGGKYRRLFANNPDLELINNNITIGYNYLLNAEEQGIDTYETEKRKLMKFYAAGNYNFLKVNSNTQPQPSVSINLEFDPVFLYYAIFM